MGAWKKFTDWYQGNNDRESEPPRSGIARVWYIILNYTGKIVFVNILFIVTCIPVITLPAALSALNRYLGKIFLVGYGMEAADYFRELKRGLLRYIPLGLFSGVLLFYAYYLMSLAGNFPGEMQRDVLTGIGAGVGAVGIVLGSWCFVLTSVLDLPGRHIFKNACILLFLEWKRSLVILAGQAVFWGGVLNFVPYSVWFLALFGFAFLQLFVCATLLPAIRSRIVEPYEKQQG